MNAGFFSEYKEITAFFSYKPEKTAELIPRLASSLPEGKYFIKPWMVHGKHIQVIDRDFLNAGRYKHYDQPGLHKLPER